jgi:hypothetical protein
MDPKPMGEQIYPELEGHDFEDRKYNLILPLLHPLACISRADESLP